MENQSQPERFKSRWPLRLKVIASALAFSFLCEQIGFASPDLPYYSKDKQASKDGYFLPEKVRDTHKKSKELQELLNLRKDLADSAQPDDFLQRVRAPKPWDVQERRLGPAGGGGLPVRFILSDRLDANGRPAAVSIYSYDANNQLQKISEYSTEGVDISSIESKAREIEGRKGRKFRGGYEEISPSIFGEKNLRSQTFFSGAGEDSRATHSVSDFDGGKPMRVSFYRYSGDALAEIESYDLENAGLDLGDPGAWKALTKDAVLADPDAALKTRTVYTGGKDEEKIDRVFEYDSAGKNIKGVTVYEYEGDALRKTTAYRGAEEAASAIQNVTIYAGAAGKEIAERTFHTVAGAVRTTTVFHYGTYNILDESVEFRGEVKSQAEEAGASKKTVTKFTGAAGEERPGRSFDYNSSGSVIRRTVFFVYDPLTRRLKGSGSFRGEVKDRPSDAVILETRAPGTAPAGAPALDPSQAVARTLSAAGLDSLVQGMGLDLDELNDRVQSFAVQEVDATSPDTFLDATIIPGAASVQYSHYNKSIIITYSNGLVVVIAPGTEGREKDITVTTVTREPDPPTDVVGEPNTTTTVSEMPNGTLVTTTEIRTKTRVNDKDVTKVETTTVTDIPPGVEPVIPQGATPVEPNASGQTRFYQTAGGDVIAVHFPGSNGIKITEHYNLTEGENYDRTVTKNDSNDISPPGYTAPAAAGSKKYEGTSERSDYESVTVDKETGDKIYTANNPADSFTRLADGSKVKNTTGGTITTQPDETIITKDARGNITSLVQPLQLPFLITPATPFQQFLPSPVVGNYEDWNAHYELSVSEGILSFVAKQWPWESIGYNFGGEGEDADWWEIDALEQYTYTLDLAKGALTVKYEVITLEDLENAAGEKTLKNQAIEKYGSESVISLRSPEAMWMLDVMSEQLQEWKGLAEGRGENQEEKKAVVAVLGNIGTGTYDKVSKKTSYTAGSILDQIQRYTQNPPESPSPGIISSTKDTRSPSPRSISETKVTDFSERSPATAQALAVSPTIPRGVYSDVSSLTMGAADLWNYSTGLGVTVAVIDSGIDFGLPSLQSNRWTNEAELNGKAGVDDDGNGYVDDVNGWNFIGGSGDIADDYGHGTALAGLIGGADGVGFAPDSRIMPLKVLGASGAGTVAGVVEAIYYAANNGAKLINLSLGANLANLSAESIEALHEAVRYAQGRGAVLVVAAGNAGEDIGKYYPASFDEVIAVGSTGADNQRAFFSNYGDALDFVAPGIDILTLRAAGASFGAPVSDRLTRASGTSLSAAMVSGTIALMLSKEPGLTLEDIKQRLSQTAGGGVQGFNPYFGLGQITSLKALSAYYSDKPATATAAAPAPAQIAPVEPEPPKKVYTPTPKQAPLKIATPTPKILPAVPTARIERVFGVDENGRPAGNVTLVKRFEGDRLVGSTLFKDIVKNAAAQINAIKISVASYIGKVGREKVERVFNFNSNGSKIRTTTVFQYEKPNGQGRLLSSITFKGEILKGNEPAAIKRSETIYEGEEGQEKAQRTLTYSTSTQEVRTYTELNYDPVDGRLLDSTSYRVLAGAEIAKLRDGSIDRAKISRRSESFYSGIKDEEKQERSISFSTGQEVKTYTQFIYDTDPQSDGRLLQSVTSRVTITVTSVVLAALRDGSIVPSSLNKRAETDYTGPEGEEKALVTRNFNFKGDLVKSSTVFDYVKDTLTHSTTFRDEVLSELGLIKSDMEEVKAIEVGNIFKQGTKFTDPFGMSYKDENGEINSFQRHHGGED
ncbi:MAG: S8 family serine peptidase [Candidatus Omnitrophica bacterium]|nr:S8 family serine peptidase [Candidatus Omnitrophota bacterium]